MAKKFGPGKCIHCLQEVAERSSDHLFPVSWYPDATPADLEKWQVPSCTPCNHSYGRMESDLLSRIGLCLDPDHPASSGLVAKALRSLKPDAAHNERDRRLRAAKGLKILRSAEGIGPLPAESVVPGFGARTDDPDGQHPILISAEHFDMLARKVVRGIYYLQDGIFIERTHVIDHCLLHPTVAEEVLAPFGTGGQTFAREPCLRIRRFVAHDDPMHAIFDIELWQQLHLYAFLESESIYNSRRSAGANS